MRWVALDVDYEMYGKDLTDSGIQSGKIAKALSGRKPEGLIYEMFLDEKGEKISKSKGNGLSIEEWLTYGSEESLAFYAYREPKSAKQLHRSEEHTSELQSLMRISYAVFCLKKKKTTSTID